MEQRAQDVAPVTVHAVAPGPPAREQASLLDAVLEATRPEQGAGAGGRLRRFLDEPEPGQALACWMGEGALPHTDGPRKLKEQVVERLERDIARLDAMLSRQVDAVLHHPRFQELESSWRGLRYLVEQVPEGENIKVRVLNVSWTELVRDLDRALEFDQSQLFRKVYSDEFGMPGGQPFGVLLGDYQMRPRPAADHPTDDVEALKSISAVAAASFAPFIAGAHPSLLDLHSFSELERPINLASTFDQVDYLKWRALRDTEDSRFVGLVLPRVLARLPHLEQGQGGGHTYGFRYQEEVGKPDRSEYLWGNAVYAFGAVLVRAFAGSGWLGDIRGSRAGAAEGGVVSGLPVHSFGTDRAGLIPKTSTEVIIPDVLDKELGDLGLLPLCWCPDTELSVFSGSQSIQKPAVYDEVPATVNARLSAMLQCVFCTSRVAHYLKVIARDKVGTFFSALECEETLRRWLVNYTNANDSPSPELKARYPLRESKVRVREVPGRPGQYNCIIHLRPQFQLDQMVASVRLVTTLTTGSPG